MLTDNIYLNGTGGVKAEAGISSGVASLISTALDFGVQYLTSQSENKKNLELVQRMAELDNKQAENLKNLLKESASETAKTLVIIDFLNKSEIKKIQDKSKKDRLLPLIGLGVGIILLSLIFYKLNKNG
jgi:hypothetical protein